MTENSPVRYPKIMNVTMVSEMIGATPQKVRDLARKGLIPARRLPGSNRWRFSRDEISAWWERHLLDPKWHDLLDIPRESTTAGNEGDQTVK